MSNARPPENRDPAPEEVAACLDYLREQTRILAPKIIVCLGRISATRIIDPGFKVTKQHGQWVEKGGIHMMGTFHPAALLRNPGNKPGALEIFWDCGKKSASYVQKYMSCKRLSAVENIKRDAQDKKS